jgi:cyclophilin family peptidyl-prolyl cis-trans isomerase
MTRWKLLIFVVLSIGLIALIGCGGSAPPEDTAKKTEEPAAKTEEPPAETKADPETATKKEEPTETAKLEPPPAPKKEAPAPAPKVAPKNPTVIVETSMGRMKVELYQDRAPGTVKNFLQYVDAKFYDGTIFHRVIPSFMVQGGGFTPDMNEKDTRAPIQNESANGLSNLRGTLAMARTPDPHSASSQFFINLPSDQRNQFLDRAQARDGWGYCVLGKVIEGLDTIDKIAAVPTGNRGPHPNVPVEPVVIKSVRRG